MLCLRGHLIPKFRSCSLWQIGPGPSRCRLLCVVTGQEARLDLPFLSGNVRPVCVTPPNAGPPEGSEATSPSVSHQPPEQKLREGGGRGELRGTPTIHHEPGEET